MEKVHYCKVHVLTQVLSVRPWVAKAGFQEPAAWRATDTWSFRNLSTTYNWVGKSTLSGAGRLGKAVRLERRPPCDALVGGWLLCHLDRDQYGGMTE